MSFGKLSISAGFFAAVTVFYLLDRDGLLIKILLCCAIHEGGHALAVKLCGGRVTGFKLGLTGGEMRTEYPRASYITEVIVAAAGGVAGLFAALLFSLCGMYVMSGISLALTAFNFLPIRPLDGGQLLCLAFSALTAPGRAEKLARAADYIFSMTFSALCMWLYLSTDAGLGLLMLASALSIATVTAKKQKILAF